jgi:hypothetical protein
MAGALGGGAAALVVDLGGGDVAVAEEILHLDDVHAGVEQQGSGGGPEGVRSVGGLPGGGAVWWLRLFHGAGELHQIIFHGAPQRPRAHRRAGELPAPGVEARPEEGTASHGATFGKPARKI